MEPLGWALVGTSGFAESTFAPAIRRSTRARLVGAVGSCVQRSREVASRHGAPSAFASLEALARDPGVQAVWVATPNHLHAPMAMELMRAGKHVLVEKPMAIRVEDARAMLETSRREGVRLKVGYHHRFRPLHQAMRERVAAGAVGRVGEVRVHFFAPYDAPPPAWRQDPATSGGWAINDVGTHLIDLMLWISGLPARVVGAGLRSQRFGLPTDDTATVLFALGDCAVGVMETSTALPSPSSRIEVYGDRGWLRADDTLGGGGTLEGTGLAPMAAEPHDPFVTEVDDFCAAVAGLASQGAEGPVCVDNVDLIQTARAMDASLAQAMGGSGR